MPVTTANVPRFERIMPEVSEKKIMTVWPGIASMRLAAGSGGWPEIAWATVFSRWASCWPGDDPGQPGGVSWRLMPGACRRYTLTNRRLIIQRGLTATEGPSIGLDEFDSIEVAILPGQDWLHAGELIFQREGKEVSASAAFPGRKPFARSA